MAAPAVRARVDVAAGARRQRSVPWDSIVLHALLIVCVAVIAFPLYFAFVISTQDLTEVVQRPPRLIEPSPYRLWRHRQQHGDVLDACLFEVMHQHDLLLLGRKPIDDPTQRVDSGCGRGRP